jgi:hypothetical protein
VAVLEMLGLAAVVLEVQLEMVVLEQQILAAAVEVEQQMGIREVLAALVL